MPSVLFRLLDVCGMADLEDDGGVVMALNISKGNMYPFVTHTWNTIKGKCPHDCSYCYMKRFKQNDLRFDKSELQTDLGKGNFIFVGSSCDMWAWTIPEEWIEKTLAHCKGSPNEFLFQSKNPSRFIKFYGQYPNSVFGTTIESNRDYEKGPPAICDRYCGISQIGREDGERVMITIEPIMDFDLQPMIDMFEDISPEWVNIGADSKGHNLPEPPAGKIRELITELERFTTVKIKKNLNRLLRECPK